MSVIDAIGLVGTLLTTIGFAQSNLPDASPRGASIRVKVGLQNTTSSDYGGRIAKIQAYDSNNAKIGDLSPGADIQSGDIADYTFDQQSPGTQSQYISFLGTNGGICLSWIVLKNLDGAADAAWTGDVGYKCGHAWNWGREVAGRDSNGQPYKPFCTWIDADHTDNIDTGAIKIDFLAYGEKLKDTISQDTACSKTIFAKDAVEIDGVPSKKTRRAISKDRPQWMTDRLLVSSFPSDNATMLCQSETSYGPDAIGSDGYYCNMATRELFPLCEMHNVEGCINIDKDNKVVTKRSLVAKRSTDLHYRSYTQVDHLDVNEVD
ncbi:hypothetical protein BU24DRAFT_399872 [Aaosphaeria arxii CBS 175.79]|uniref:Uncharacterized protein n=1 Tax=Aaosphaeria arxii CBS 175.79 TaxID=1450172 RepID=A0A6A5XC04_9PLEO|nr:uncharacterized protein BU24DRAFT_399872 [Aaosphaeria arxii CBS 175.79]KAF2010488.1 hypothetical protein BU24DRAFT_399872 [Aaosphaeria arxii CBS 175.79]